MRKEIKSAIEQLNSRPEHIETSQISPVETLSYRKEMHQYNQSIYGKQIFKPTSTYAPQPLNEDFTYLTTIKINPKKVEENQKALTVHIYHYSNNGLDYYICFSNSITNSRFSLAKIVLQSCNSAKYPECTSTETTVVSKVNNLHQSHRIGTALIQIAIEHSLKSGLGGRILLMSLQDEFYTKLGFLAYKEKGINASMYLPQEVIASWLKKIVEHPIILSPEQARQYLEVMPQPIITPVSNKRIGFFTLSSTTNRQPERPYRELEPRPLFLGAMSLATCLVLLLLMTQSKDNSLQEQNFSPKF